MSDRLSNQFLPYCLVRQADGTYEIYNADMKPVAFRPDQFGLTGDGAGFVRFDGITPELAARLSWRGEARVDRIELFDEVRAPSEGSAHMHEYLQRLAVLTKLQATEAVD